MGEDAVALGRHAVGPKGWLRLWEGPNWALPMAASVLLGTALVVAYFHQVDAAWLVDQFVNHDARLAELTEEKRQKIASMMSGAFVEKAYLAAILVGLPLARFAEALYYHLAGKLLGLRVGFKRWLALTCWSSLPLLLPVAAALLTLSMRHAQQMTLESLDGLSLNELLLHRAAGAPGYALATSLTIAHPWAWGLAASGVRAWSGRSWAFSATMALLPWVVIYGGWAIAGAT
jgi:hypothetical protein